MISMMRVGVCSTIGSFAISGMPTIADNTCRIFQTNGVISDLGSFPDAARFARNLASGLQEPLPDRLSRKFTDTHEQICEQVAEVPASLQAAFKAFQSQPSTLGMALYFNLLADLLDAAHQNRSRPKSS